MSACLSMSWQCTQVNDPLQHLGNRYLSCDELEMVNTVAVVAILVAVGINRLCTHSCL